MKQWPGNFIGSTRGKWTSKIEHFLSHFQSGRGATLPALPDLRCCCAPDPTPESIASRTSATKRILSHPLSSGVDDSLAFVRPFVRRPAACIGRQPGKKARWCRVANYSITERFRHDIPPSTDGRTSARRTVGGRVYGYTAARTHLADR